MVKGVNKNVIEIVETGNDCFERAILFVRPAGLRQNAGMLQHRGREFLSGLRMRPWLYARPRWLFTALTLAAGALAGSGVTALFFLL